METKEFKIIPPEGYEVDKENSTSECIKFKPVIKRWADDEDAKINGYFIGRDSNLCDITTKNLYNTPQNYNVFATEKQAKSALAMARISQIMANDERFGGVVTDEKWNDMDVCKFCIERQQNQIAVKYYHSRYCFLAFHIKEQRDLFLEENEQLVKEYLMID